MERQDVNQTYIRFKPLIDSLLQQDFEFHYFDVGFKKDALEKALNKKHDTLFQNPMPYWSLLTALNQKVPRGLPVYLFTNNKLQRFAGNRPVVAMNLNWHTYTPEDSSAEWLANAYETTADSVRFVTAKSQPSGTFYTYAGTSMGPQKTSDYNLYTDGKNLLATFRNSAPVVVDTATFEVTIFTDKYPTDATYLKAAIGAIQQFSERKIKLSVVTNPNAIPLQQDWVFWLSDAPVRSNIGRNVFIYEKGKPETDSSWIKGEDNQAIPEPLLLYKRIPHQPSSNVLQTIWRDGFGKPVLELEKGKANRYRFFSRFDPSWNELTWSPVFPWLIFNLIFSEHHSISVLDNRVIDNRQLQPAFTSKNEAVIKDTFLITHELSKIFWVAAFVVFFAERALSFKMQKQKINA